MVEVEFMPSEEKPPGLFEPGGPGGPGRPPLEFDLEKLREFCRIAPTLAEVAAFFGCDPKTVERRYAKDPEFARIVDEGREGFRASQRRAFAAAVARVASGDVERGDSSLVIFLAKQRERMGGLGFSDRHEHEHSGEVKTWVELLAGDEAEPREGVGDE